MLSAPKQASSGPFKNSQHSETRTPLFAGPVLLFFFLLGYLKLQKKLPHHSQQARLNCRSVLLADTHGPFGLTDSSFTNSGRTGRKGKRPHRDGICEPRARGGRAPRGLSSSAAGLIQPECTALLVHHRDGGQTCPVSQENGHQGTGRHPRLQEERLPRRPSPLPLPGGVRAAGGGFTGSRGELGLTLSAPRSAASSSGNARDVRVRSHLLDPK